VAMGCDFGQGMLIAAPMPKTQFLGLLRERAHAARPQPEGKPAAAEGHAVA
jgi:hypothetical protein